MFVSGDSIKNVNKILAQLDVELSSLQSIDIPMVIFILFLNFFFLLLFFSPIICFQITLEINPKISDFIKKQVCVCFLFFSRSNSWPAETSWQHGAHLGRLRRRAQGSTAV
jgi:hypothetical protein